MNIVIINKSDSTGGAAVVSRRLMEALRAEGADARMLVVEKLTDSPVVEVAAPPEKSMMPFLAERLRIFLANGLDRGTLFKVDAASDGLPLWEHPLVRTADAVLLNWVNQGMLSLRGVRKILELGKPVVWTMHDMWCMTGICHHAGECGRYTEECGRCPFLGKMKRGNDLSRRVWKRKKTLYGSGAICFVAVSRWLAGRAAESSLLGSERVEVIPNAFRIPDAPADVPSGKISADEHGISAPEIIGGSAPVITLLFGAARLDDPIKGLPVLTEMTRVMKEKYPRLAEKMEIVTFGGVKDRASLSGFAITHRHMGTVSGEDKVRKLYENADILVSSSSYETLPGTLVEAQAYGCIPVSFDRGGQADIVTHMADGYLAEYSDNIKLAAAHLADGVAWAAAIVENPDEYGEIRKRMRRNVEERFAARKVARRYLRLLEDMLGERKTRGF